MTRSSPHDLLVLHSVRLLGFADDTAIADRFGTGSEETSRALRAAERSGWVRHTAFADLGGWSLTDAGTLENEERLAAERISADPDGEVESVHHRFLPLNARFLQAVTDWQLSPTEADRFAPNDHTDRTWDRRVFDELAAVGTDLAPLVERLARVLARFDGYAARYDRALLNAKDGRPEWIDSTGIDSCHRVWFQLHEDLLATLGINRRDEP